MKNKQQCKELYRIYEQLDNGQRDTLLSVARRILDARRLLKDKDVQEEKEIKVKIENK
jgi:hypothetical protein